MQQTWQEWANLLFVKAYHEELMKMRAFQAEYDPILFAKL
jgi:hypothetical protein